MSSSGILEYHELKDVRRFRPRFSNNSVALAYSRLLTKFGSPNSITKVNGVIEATWDKPTLKDRLKCWEKIIIRDEITKYNKPFKHDGFIIFEYYLPLMKDYNNTIKWKTDESMILRKFPEYNEKDMIRTTTELNLLAEFVAYEPKESRLVIHTNCVKYANAICALCIELVEGYRMNIKTGIDERVTFDDVMKHKTLKNYTDLVDPKKSKYHNQMNKYFNRQLCLAAGYSQIYRDTLYVHEI